MSEEPLPSVELVRVTAGNWREVADIAPAPEQERFVAPVTRYLCLCNYGDDWHPLAIRHGDDTVGFVMWAVDTDASRWIGGLVVDADAQGQGMGTAAVRALVEWLGAQEGCTQIALSYEPANAAARRLYARLGFIETGEQEGEEIVARLNV